MAGSVEHALPLVVDSVGNVVHVQADLRYRPEELHVVSDEHIQARPGVIKQEPVGIRAESWDRTFTMVYHAANGQSFQWPVQHAVLARDGE